jgi:Ca-activated chloride channel family protein
MVSAASLACLYADESSAPAAVEAPAEQAQRAQPSGEVALEETPIVAELEVDEAEEAGAADKTVAEPPPPPADAAAIPASPMPAQERKGMSGGMGRVGGPGMVARPLPERQPTDNEGYDHIEENDFIAVADDARSTFSIDVDTASYANVRRFIEDGSMPPVDAVRIEELVNYFAYDYEAPIGSDPFSMNAEVSASPWNRDNLLVSIGLQGKTIDQSEAPTRNLVFLLDVSGSMNDPDKLPLLKRGLSLLVENLRDDDKVSIVVYAGASGVVLQPTSGRDKHAILDALERLEAGGSTNGGEGIQLAYALARKSFVKGGINRVVLATDGDFNVGATSRGDLMRLIEEKRESGVFLSVLGFGTGNVKDSTMEQIADKGNGNYAYIDSIHEAKKVLVEEAGATLVTIAKDVKIQVEFNPTEVASYRLIGYENRKLAHSDFNDDSKDAGEIGAGHSVTALYEVVPAGTKKIGRSTDKLQYQEEPKLTKAASSGELMTVKIRYKQPEGGKSKLLSFPVVPADKGLESTSNDYRFAVAVAEFGMLLRNSKHRADASYDDVMRLAKGALGDDAHGHRGAFLGLVSKTKALAAERGALARRE